ncbi:TonB family protein [Paramuribaculum intestinale]|uniref:TonB family protein n=1 Tax=Paramuribaculum intestinale TaxID=2094151 RepID=UPI0025AF6263|nr:TonB family protein [Paramuribaculum intestinale]
MARGKQTCKILKEIRRQIAEANGIEFVTSECRYKGDCLGTCPKCEAEVHYLEQQLRVRSLAGKAVAIAGISAGIVLMSGCSGTTSSNQSSETLQGEPVALIEQIEATDSIEDEGELPAIKDTVVIKKGEIEDTKYPVVGEIIDPEQEDKVYEVIVDIRPTFPGGDEKLMEWISQHIQYPQNAYDSHIQGRVIVQFLVKEDGSVGDAKIIRSVFPSLDEEALRVVTRLPEFNPAILDGKAVEYWFTIPIVFRLEDDLKSHKKAKNSAIIARQSEIKVAPTANFDENRIYHIVEQMPEYPGGQTALLKFIGANLKYPKEMVDCFQGSVIVRFYVDSLGHVCDPQIVRGLDSALDREVLRVVRLFPDFIPGQHEGRKVNVYMNLPISFDPNRY